MDGTKYAYTDLTGYVQKNPSIISEIMTLVSCYNLPRVKEFFTKLDLSKPYVESSNNYEYSKYKSDIDEIITSPDAYIVKPDKLDQDYMDDAYIIKTYSETVDIFDEVVTNYLPPVPRQESIDLLDIGSDDKILEICIGPGSSFEHYPEVGNVIGIDISPKSINAANAKINRLSLKNIKAELRDIHNSLFIENEFDKVISICGLCVVRNPFLAMKEIKRISKPGAKIVLYEPCLPPIKEISILLYLLQPIARKLGGVWYKDFPPYVVPYNSYLDLFGIIEKLGFEIETHKIFDPPFNIINLLACKNCK